MEVTRVTRDAKRQLKTGWWYTYPSEKMMELKSVGMIKFPTELKVIIHSCSSHHQPDIASPAARLRKGT